MNNPQLLFGPLHSVYRTSVNNRLKKHGQPSSGTRSLNIHPYMLFQVPTLCEQAATVLKRLHIYDGLTKPLVFVYTQAVRHVP